MRQCRWFCKNHHLQCKRPKSHQGLHTAECGCIGACDFGYAKNDNEMKGFYYKR